MFSKYKNLQYYLYSVGQKTKIGVGVRESEIKSQMSSTSFGTLSLLFGLS